MSARVVVYFLVVAGGILSVYFSRISIFTTLLVVIALASLTHFSHPRKLAVKWSLIVALLCCLVGLGRFIMVDALLGIVGARSMATNKKAVSMLREILFAEEAFMRHGAIPKRSSTNTSATAQPSSAAANTQPSNAAANTQPSSNAAANTHPSNAAANAEPSSATTAEPSSAAANTQPSNAAATAEPSSDATTSAFTGAAGLLTELAGVSSARIERPMKVAPLNPRFAPRVITPAGPAAAMEGYLFLICLPLQGGGFSAELGKNFDSSSSRFAAYAWPAGLQTPARGAYFINEKEEILAMEGSDELADSSRPDSYRFLGTERMPDCASALAESRESFWKPWRGKKARDASENP